jgi:CheY-like chemotaxis protein
MSRVLVVDDEPDYCDELYVALSAAGHEVTLAATAREAVDAGVRSRPDVLVADWMLKDDVHGLRVAAALRAVRPDLQTILITGFGSPDLRAEAERCWVFDFIEKPFDVDRIQQAVRDAGHAAAPPPGPSLIAVMEVDAAGAIVYVNERAKALLAATQAGPDATRIGDVLGPEAPAVLNDAGQRWVDVSPRSAAPVAWHIRAKPWPQGDGRLLIVLPADERERKYHSLVKTLLGDTEPTIIRWPLDGQVLIIDCSGMVRRVVATELEQAGCICHAAADSEMGLRLLRRDPRIQVVILDADQPDETVCAVVARLRELRPEIRIVGTGTNDCRAALAKAGVRLFLLKPFVIDDLVNVLTDRIGKCIDCGLPIPLRRVRPGDVGRSWECCGCGSRYLAVLDEGSPPDLRRNVRPADRSYP